MCPLLLPRRKPNAQFDWSSGMADWDDGMEGTGLGMGGLDWRMRCVTLRKMQGRPGGRRNQWEMVRPPLPAPFTKTIGRGEATK